MRAFRLMAVVCLAAAVMLITAPLRPEENKVKIVFFSPRGPDDIFWEQFASFMKEAIDDLGMEMKVYFANGNHVKMVEQAEHALKEDNPSMLVFQNFKKQGRVILEMAEAARVPSFIVNAGFSERDELGKPREKFKYWIGEMLPDDEEAGFVLADILIRNAPSRPDGSVYMVALTGNIADSASAERQRGLERAVRIHPHVRLQQVFSTDWSSDMARMKFNLLKKSRYPDTSVVWAAGDAVALGVISGAGDLDLKVGTDIITGGVDWSAEGLRSVLAGEMTATMGGHFMEGAWVAVLAYDYFHGKDFAAETVRMRSRMSAVTKVNAESYINALGRENWGKIDFRKFSKALNSAALQYDFSVQSVLNQVK